MQSILLALAVAFCVQTLASLSAIPCRFCVVPTAGGVGGAPPIRAAVRAAATNQRSRRRRGRSRRVSFHGAAGGRINTVSLLSLSPSISYLYLDICVSVV